MTWRVSVTVAVALAGVALALVLQAYLRGSTVEFLSRPIPVGGGASLVAADVRPREVPTDGALRVALYLEGPGGVPPPRVLLAPIGFATPFERVPDLGRRTTSTDGLRRVDLELAVPAYLRDRPGSYTLRVAGRGPTFGLVDLVRPRAG